ncbi:MAG: hypothetical protein RLZZ628_1777 [Bacteroidota bacterium]|jgi:transcriptional regulator with XRE-family HTH domain
MQFGNNLKVLLKQKNIRQAKFAEMMGIGNTSISNWINNTSYPDFRTLLRIKEILNIDLETLIFGNLEGINKMDDLDKMDNFKLFGKSEKELSPKNTAQGNGKDELYERLLKEKDERIIELKEKIQWLESKIGK